MTVQALLCFVARLPRTRHFTEIKKRRTAGNQVVCHGLVMPTPAARQKLCGFFCRHEVKRRNNSRPILFGEPIKGQLGG